MKKTVKLLAVVMVIAILAISLVSCSKSISGKYSNEILGVKTTYEFGLFGKVTRTVYVPATLFTPESTTVVEGKYEILEDNDDPEKLIIAFEFEGEERTTSSFAEGTEGNKKYIKIGLLQYTAE